MNSLNEIFKHSLSYKNLELKEVVQKKINLKTKPIGSLGKLEEYALKISLIQNTLSPNLENPQMIIFASDHGLAKEGISPFPQEVTFQMVMNFLNEGAAINSFCKTNQIELSIVDAGVNYDFSGIDGLIHSKISFGTKNILEQKAMNRLELEKAILSGYEITKNIIEKKDASIICFGEMGIGNTGISSLLMSKLIGLDLNETVGRGTGSSDEELEKKISVLKKAISKHHTSDDPLEVLETFGGFEIAMILGGIFAAAHQNVSILIDGFIVTVAYLIAHKLNPKIELYCFFSHLSDEKAHMKLLNYLKADPILKLNMRLGEGTGAALAYPILKNSIGFLNDMASFEEAGISDKN
jgi:nicotinate-nucleotide--dimethylbenzimidazole phosphoribosyltransferase